MTEGRPGRRASTIGQVRPAGQPRAKAYPRPSSHARPKSADSNREREIRILSNTDILEARKQGRELAAELGFASIDCTLIATAISELARNIVLYAGEGEIRLRRETALNHSGIVIVASDRGPGIRDLRNALQDGFSTSRGLGLGLPGVKRIMDEFEIDSRPRHGTTVTVKKWKTP